MDISSLREPRERNTLTVSELNGYIKNLFERDRTLSSVSVKGEISNFTNHRSGHLYFTLKDEGGQVKSVMFRSSALRLKFMPENGMRVVVHGSVAVYQRDGAYQIYVNTIEPDGVGALYLAYEQLKEKLYREGLFDEIHKKALPEYPERIGVITSPTGAAVRDIINVIGRRFPLARIYLYPSLVQGEGASENLIRALDYFEASRLCDVIIIGRGGGSIEDLWAFNSEELARKIYSLSIPVISAVGHETDFTICDFVADMRAPTPSAAAELAVPDIRELIYRIDSYNERLLSSLSRAVERKREQLEALADREVIRNPMTAILKNRELFEEYKSDLMERIKGIIKDKKAELVVLSEKLGALSPLSVLGRGYAIVERGSTAVKSVADLSVGDELLIKLSDGSAHAVVDRITKKKGEMHNEK